MENCATIPNTFLLLLSFDELRTIKCLLDFSLSFLPVCPFH